MEIPDYFAKEWFWAMWQFFGVTASLIYLSRQVRAERIRTMLDTLSTVAQKWSSPEMKEARRELCEEYLHAGVRLQMSDSAHQVASFFNNLGVLVEMRVLHEVYVWSRFSNHIEHYWLLLRRGIDTYRKERGDQSWFKSFETLHAKTCHTTVRLNKERGFKRFLSRFAKPPILSQSQIEASCKRFANEELAQARTQSGLDREKDGIPALLRLVATWLDPTVRL